MISSTKRRALSNLLDAHGERLYATLARLTLRRDVASDLLQELFVKLGQSGGFDAANDPAAYAWRVAINLAMQWRRSRRITSAIDEQSLLATEASPLERIIRAEEFERLLDALHELSELSREAFVLRFIEEKSYDVIAVRIGKTPHQARGLCHAAVKQLRQKFVSAERS